MKFQNEVERQLWVKVYGTVIGPDGNMVMAVNSADVAVQQLRKREPEPLSFDGVKLDDRQLEGWQGEL